MEYLIAVWRTHLRRHEAPDVDVEELERRLRDQIAALRDAGLVDDEAFLIAVRRVGKTDAASREYARKHFERLWERPVPDPVGADEGGRSLPIWERVLALLVPDSAVGGDGRSARSELLVVFGLAIAAAVAIKVPEIFGYFRPDRRRRRLYARKEQFFLVLPMLGILCLVGRGAKRRPNLFGSSCHSMRRAIKVPEVFGYIDPSTETGTVRPRTSVWRSTCHSALLTGLCFVGLTSANLCWRSAWAKRGPISLASCHSLRRPSPTSSRSKETGIPRRSRRSTCHSPCGWSSVSPTSAVCGAPSSGARTSCDSPATVHLLRAHCARWRRVLPPDLGHVRGHRP